MSSKSTGYIYVITNKAMPGIVKIGYSKNVSKRVNSFYSSNVPFPFEVYATLEGVSESADKEIHKMLPASLRVNDNREFFNITPEYAYDVLFQIAKVFGVTNRLRKWDEEEIAAESSSQDDGLKPRHKGRIVFWENFNKVNAAMGSPLKMVDEGQMTRNWQYFSIGGGKCHLEVWVVGQKHKAGITILTHNKDIHKKLDSARTQFEKELGTKLDWNVSKSSNFWAALYKEVQGLDFNNTSNYPTLIKEVIETAVKMKDAYQKLGFAK